MQYPRALLPYIAKLYMAQIKKEGRYKIIFHPVLWEEIQKHCNGITQEATLVETLQQEIRNSFASLTIVKEFLLVTEETIEGPPVYYRVFFPAIIH